MRATLMLVPLMMIVAATAATAAEAVSSQPVSVYAPGETQVAILPFVNLTGEDQEDMLDDVAFVDHTIAALFLERGFGVIADSSVVSAMEEMGMPAHDRAELTAENMSALARATDADLVVSGVIVDKRDTRAGPKLFAPSRKEGRAAVRTYVWDESRGAFVVAGQTAAKAAGRVSLLYHTSRVSDLRRQALRRAAADSVMELLRPYRACVKRPDVSARTAYRQFVRRSMMVPATEWEPGNTVVALLPFVDETKPDTRAADSHDALEEAAAEAQRQFAACGFKLVSLEDGTVSALGAEAATDGMAPRPDELLRRIGGDAGADVVVAGHLLLVVTSGVRSQMVKVEMRVFDLHLNRCVLVGPGSAALSTWRKASAQAVANALRELLAPYCEQGQSAG